MKTTLQGQFSLKCLDQRIQQTLILDKKKVIIGSDDHCDYKLNDPSISSVHAFLFLKNDEGLMVKDLYSEGGTFVNGKKVDEAYVNPGDIVTFGTLSFSIESLGEHVPLFNPDEDKKVVEPAQNVVLPPKPGLVFIDGEYCDIEFDDSNYRPLTSLPKINFLGKYIDLDQSQEALDIAHGVKDKRLEIVHYVNGLMMDVSYLSMKDGDYFLNPAKKSKTDILFHTVTKSKIFTISKGELRFHVSEQVTVSTAWDKIDLSEPLFLTNGAEQLSLRLVDNTTSWKAIPFFYRDKEFFKQGAKVFAGVFLPLLLLLFITIPEPEAVKEDVAIVYQLPQKVLERDVPQEKSEVAAQEPTNQIENTGHKAEDQPKEKVEYAQASAVKKVVAKAAAPKAVAAPTNPVPTPPVKTYEFKSSVALTSLTATAAPKINTQGSAQNSAVKDAAFNAGTSDNGQMVAGANIGVSKFNGSDKTGTGSASYGSRGLAVKKGFDSSYLEPKTVVLGSMDPELLRKILREYIPQFRHCYQQELIGKSDNVKGVIDLNFTIGASGKVSKYDIKSKDAQFSNKGVGCMGQVLGLIEFPKPKGGGVVDVRQPLNFFSEAEKI